MFFIFVLKDLAGRMAFKVVLIFCNGKKLSVVVVLFCFVFIFIVERVMIHMYIYIYIIKQLLEWCDKIKTDNGSI